MSKNLLLLFIILFAFVVTHPAFADLPVASRIGGENVYFYASLHEAVAAVEGNASAGSSIDAPFEITLLGDIVLDEPLLIPGGTHIRLLPGGGDVTIRRGYENIEYPVIWVSGDSSSLSLGKAGMQSMPGELASMGSLIIDGGYLNDPPIHAHAPLIAVSGPDVKLIMYDGVILQNNCNNGTPPGTSIYQLGGGVFIRTEDNLQDRKAEFIMRGGVIRGNLNIVQTPLACGGGVYIAGFAVFTMEGGVIMNNLAFINGGGFHTGGRGDFRKTGGIIYGSNAPEGYRNTAVIGAAKPVYYGHSVSVALVYHPYFHYRDDTITENERLSYIGSPDSTIKGIFGEGEKWYSLDTLIFRRNLRVAFWSALALALGAAIILFIYKYKKRPKVSANIEIDLSLFSAREKKVLDLLLTDQSIKMIADVLGLTHAGVTFHSNKIYRKLNVQSRKELLARYKK